MTHRPPDSHHQLFAALSAAERGWHVFPLVPGSKRPAIRQWEQRATTDLNRIRRCWERCPYNVGIAAGPSRLVIVDLDAPKPGEEGPSGAEALAALCQRHGQPLPGRTTFTVSTPSGGLHLYYGSPAGTALRNTAGKIAARVDTRAAGGYVVAPGSVVDARAYRKIRDLPTAELPGWLAALLAPPALPPQRPVTIGMRTTDRRSAYLDAAVNAELRRVQLSGPDQHNQDLYRASVALGQLIAGGELDANEVTAWLTQAAASVGQGPGETRRTIASGFRAGARRPRRVETAA